VARVLDLGKSCVEHGRVAGAQFWPRTELRLLVIRRIVGELDAEMSPPGKLTTSIG
jgi:hypothetical protein